MSYSLTIHKDHKRVFFYRLNKAVCVALDVALTGAVIAKLEQAIKAQG